MSNYQFKNSKQIIHNDWWYTKCQFIPKTPRIFTLGFLGICCSLNLLHFFQPVLSLKTQFNYCLLLSKSKMKYSIDKSINYDGTSCLIRILTISKVLNLSHGIRFIAFLSNPLKLSFFQELLLETAFWNDSVFSLEQQQMCQHILA